MNEATLLLLEMAHEREIRRLAEIKQLRGELRGARDLLFRHQWGGSGHCPECAADRNLGHRTTCPWARALGMPRQMIATGPKPEETNVSSRFDYVRYTAESATLQRRAQALCIELEQLIDEICDDPGVQQQPRETRGLVQREGALALTRLEDVYMRVGRAIRYRQVAVGGDATDLNQAPG